MNQNMCNVIIEMLFNKSCLYTFGNIEIYQVFINIADTKSHCILISTLSDDT